MTTGLKSDRPASATTYHQIAKGLGWFSIALGAAEIAIPETIAMFAGLRNEPRTRRLLRSPLFGPREIAAGIGILSQPNPAKWMWGRVAGDVLDLGAMAAGLISPRNRRGRLTAALLAVMGVTAVDYICAQQLSRASDGVERKRREHHGYLASASRSIWVNRLPAEAYNYWKNIENLPRFMHHVESVQDLGGGKSRWRAKGPLGKSIEWTAQTVDDQPDGKIGWKTVEGSSVHNCGAVTFEAGPGGRGTIVRVELDYGTTGSAAARHRATQDSASARV